MYSGNYFGAQYYAGLGIPTYFQTPQAVPQPVQVHFKYYLDSNLAPQVSTTVVPVASQGIFDPVYNQQFLNPVNVFANHRETYSGYTQNSHLTSRSYWLENEARQMPILAECDIKKEYLEELDRPKDLVDLTIPQQKIAAFESNERSFLVKEELKELENPNDHIDSTNPHQKIAAFESNERSFLVKPEEELLELDNPKDPIDLSIPHQKVPVFDNNGKSITTVKTGTTKMANNEASIPTEIFTLIDLEDTNDNSESKIVKPTNNIQPKVKCDLCHMEFSKHAYYKQHFNSIHTGKKVRCNSCKKLFHSAKEMEDHSKNHLDENKKYQCSLCPLKFMSRQSLGRHETKIHRKSGYLLKCSRCPKTYYRRDQMTKHEDVHKKRDLRYNY